MQRIFFLFIIIIGSNSCIFSQIKVPACPLDSADFQKTYQWRIWQRDTNLAKNVENYLNYFVALRRNFLPSNIDLKKEVKNKLKKEQIMDLKTLDSLYLSNVAAKESRFLGEQLGFNDNLPAFTYLNLLMVFEVFKTYPDIYAMLLNSSHRITKSHTKANVSVDLDDLIAKIQKETTKHSWEKYHSKFEGFRNNMIDLKKAEAHVEMWQDQGVLAEDKRLEYDWINFLIWCARDY